MIGTYLVFSPVIGLTGQRKVIHLRVFVPALCMHVHLASSHVCLHDSSDTCPPSVAAGKH